MHYFRSQALKRTRERPTARVFLAFSPEVSSGVWPTSFWNPDSAPNPLAGYPGVFHIVHHLHVETPQKRTQPIWILYKSRSNINQAEKRIRAAIGYGDVQIWRMRVQHNKAGRKHLNALLELIGGYQGLCGLAVVVTRSHRHLDQGTSDDQRTTVVSCPSMI